MPHLPIGKNMALVHCSDNALSTAGVLPGHGPSSKVSTTSPSRAEHLSCALGDHDHVRLGDALQTRSEVWCLADNAALLRLAGADQVADDNEPGCDADT